MSSADLAIRHMHQLTWFVRVTGHIRSAENAGDLQVFP